MNSTKALLQFISNSPTAFHAVESVSRQLDENGFVCLKESDTWDLAPGKGYYFTRNQSSIIAFRMPTEAPTRFLITASHTDSPCFKLKKNHLSAQGDSYIRLVTEVYGGTILSSWCDRPLSLAGRVILCKDGNFTAKTVKIDRDLLVIPNVCIHMNRNINTGYTYNAAVDMMPLFAQKGTGEDPIKNLIAEELQCDPTEIAEMELFVYSRTSGAIWGPSNEFFSAPRIDNLMSVYATLQGFLQAPVQADSVCVFYAADNEETGSSTKQGAASVMLSDALERISRATNADKMQLLASSMMVSADNAHAIHPNHPELSDAQNAPRMNAGVVIKSNAAQKYATDAISAALFSRICQEASVPTQSYANRSDMPGGSTLGSIANTKVPLITVDVGMAQLAMHSAYETAGALDTQYLIDATARFYNTQIIANGDGSYRLIFNT